MNCFFITIDVYINKRKMLTCVGHKYEIKSRNKILEIVYF